MSEPTGHLAIGVRLFNNGEFFECHEVLEEEWMHLRGPRRMFLQALIHFAVGLYHADRGNTLGASKQLRKGLRKVSGYLPEYEGIDTNRLRTDTLEALECLEAGRTLPGYPRIHTMTTAGL